MKNETKYPNITIDLKNVDGNIFAILATVKRQSRRQGLTSEQFLEFQKETSKGDYNHVLKTIIDYFDIEA